MINLGCDIFLFKDIIPNELINNLLSLRKNSGTTDRINLHECDMSIFHQFNDFWNSRIETLMMDDYFKIYDLKTGKGFNVSEQTIKEIKQYVSTKWRDVFLLHYSPNNSGNSENNVHWDFSGLTTVGCLSDEYDGGILTFPRQNITVKLNKGDVVVFPGGITHPHYVTQTSGGVRNVIVGQSLTLPQDHKINY
jgi:hypothetical protein